MLTISPRDLFTTVAINRSRTLADVLHDDCDIAVIYMKSTENEDQVTFGSFHVHSTDTVK